MPTRNRAAKYPNVEIEKFLSEGANGPEHQALRNLIETSARMATLLIAYDIHPTEGEGYDNLIETIQSLGDWWHHLESDLDCEMRSFTARNTRPIEIAYRD